mmetsp:Transcript_18813/g.24815  ORF Transcript_18813/g.24815 Transcript_18813/m.24815 type:complete len:321 (+) Transcript_18813:34-996(+)
MSLNFLNKENVGVGICAFLAGFAACSIVTRSIHSIVKLKVAFDINNTSTQQDEKTNDQRIFVATRIHERNASKPTDLDAVKLFCQKAITYGKDVTIAVCAEEDGGGEDLAKRVETTAIEAVGLGKITVLKVQPWGAFTPALNALLAEAAKKGYRYILFQSLETVLDKTVAQELQSNLGEDDLVVGAALPGHDFRPGVQELNGRTTPWNTLALWSVDKLALTGFLPVAEGLHEGLDAGVEEVTAISLLQSIRPKSSNAKLIKMPQIEWETKWKDPERKRWHQKKMASKISRADAQLQHLALKEPAFVKHFDIKTACKTTSA